LAKTFFLFFEALPASKACSLFLGSGLQRYEALSDFQAPGAAFFLFLFRPAPVKEAFRPPFLLKRVAKVSSFFLSATPRRKLFSLSCFPPGLLPVWGVQRSEKFPIPQGAPLLFDLNFSMVSYNSLNCTAKISKTILKFLFIA
jgi:hypothetical protein